VATAVVVATEAVAVATAAVVVPVATEAGAAVEGPAGSRLVRPRETKPRHGR